MSFSASLVCHKYSGVNIELRETRVVQNLIMQGIIKVGKKKILQ